MNGQTIKFHKRREENAQFLDSLLYTYSLPLGFSLPSLICTVLIYSASSFWNSCKNLGIIHAVTNVALIWPSFLIVFMLYIWSWMSTFFSFQNLCAVVNKCFFFDVSQQACLMVYCHIVWTVVSLSFSKPVISFCHFFTTMLVHPFVREYYRNVDLYLLQ